MAAKTARNSFYRAVQFVNLFESVAAIICMILVLRYRKKLTTHINIEILLSILYLACFCHAVTYTVSKAYQLILSYFEMNPCHVFLPRIFYIVTHSLIVYTNCCMQNIQIMMIIERCVATVFVETYERRCGTLGTILGAITVIGTTMEVLGGYKAITINVLMTNSMLHTDPSANDVTMTFAVIFVICCICFFITISLYCFNSRRRKRSTLTSRYQISENTFMSALLCVISSTQLITFAVYASSMMTIRLTATNDHLLDGYKEAAYMVPLNTLLMPLGTIIFVEISNRRHRRGIKSMVTMKTNGPEGWNNYLSVLNQQWK